MKAPPPIKARAPKMGPPDGVKVPEGNVKKLSMKAGMKAKPKGKMSGMASRMMDGDIGSGY
jgi:hypothetical protein